MIRLFVFAMGVVFAVVVAVLAGPSGPVFAIATGLAAGFALPLIDAAISMGTHLKLVWYSIANYSSLLRV